MLHLLLITDVPRLRHVFSRLSDDRSIKLRVASSLEEGGEKLVEEKPGIIFVQTHLSGLSADILLMHLKKQLGRKRARFVLLAAPSQVGDETLRNYQGHLDSSLDDDELFSSLCELLNSFSSKAAKNAPVLEAETEESQPAAPVEDIFGLNASADFMQDLSAISAETIQQDISSEELTLFSKEEPSLVEQGITYAPRPRITVSSEFNNSFDTAVSNVSSIPSVESFTVTSAAQHSPEMIEESIPIEFSKPRSSRTTFFFWLAPVVIAVVVVTIMQHRRSTSVKTNATPLVKQALVTSAKKAVPPVAGEQKSVVQAFKPVSTSRPAMVKSELPVAAADSRSKKEHAADKTASPRLQELPAFIPVAGHDKEYRTAHTGWDRYVNDTTEFKVRRENSTIKTIQIIDLSGTGVKEPFVNTVIHQVGKNPVFRMESSETKEGIEIQRGKFADNLKAIFYRDAKGPRLRAFVLTWS